jgi:hypothetical protein
VVVNPSPGFVRTSFLGKDGTMPSKYDETMKAKAVRLVRDHADDYDSSGSAGLPDGNGRCLTSGITVLIWLTRSLSAR